MGVPLRPQKELEVRARCSLLPRTEREENPRSDWDPPTFSIRSTAHLAARRRRRR
eukprot:COSAG01_NODE_14836_length_1404_cov_6.091954_3_plen_54_part_01